MALNLVLAVTDGDWFRYLRERPHLDEVNFWSPGSAPFKALTPGELFLFKLHSPTNFVVGGGIFAHATEMPCSLAWEAFGEANGAENFTSMRSRIARYRRLSSDSREDFRIGCRILTQPFFVDEIDWLPVPESWSRNIVSFKTYSTDDEDGQMLWEFALRAMQLPTRPSALNEGERYGSPTLVKPRLGQGAFRMVVTDQYHRRCAVTGERTLPALEAAHIMPFSEGGSHEASNGLLLRRDLHSLFDRGYVTVSTDSVFEVSDKIREEFKNGRDYYRLRGTQLAKPASNEAAPDREAVEWHHNNRYLG